MQKASDRHSISILEALRLGGHNQLDWLSFPPEHLRIDVVFHGMKLGRQAVLICKSHKWVQVVHNDPEELGMFRCYEKPIATGEEKCLIEVELCQMAAFDEGVGPKVGKAFHKYLLFVKDTKMFLCYLVVFLMTFPTFNKFLKRERSAVFWLWRC